MEPKTKLLDQVRGAIRLRHLSLRTEAAYLAASSQELLGHKDVKTTIMYTPCCSAVGKACAFYSLCGEATRWNASPLLFV